MLSRIRTSLPLAVVGLCAAAGVATPASAVTTTLDFSGAICGAGRACGNGDAISQSYGDSQIVDVGYRAFNAATGVTTEPFLKYWRSGYGSLVDVVWGGTNPSNFTAEIVFRPAAGFEVSLLGFDAGCYLFRASCRTLNYAVSRVGGATLAGGSQAVPNTSTAVTLDTAYVSDGIVLRWGPDSYDVGLDNIRFDVRAIGGAPGAIPEPATWAMMIAGFGMVAGVARRRRPAMLAA